MKRLGCFMALVCCLIISFPLLSTAQDEKGTKPPITNISNINNAVKDLKEWFGKTGGMNLTADEIFKDFNALQAAYNSFLEQKVSEKFSSRFWRLFLEDFINAYKKKEKEEFRNIEKSIIQQAQEAARSKTKDQ